MSEYIPSTSIVQGRYADDSHGGLSSRHSRLEEFNRWLNKIKAEVWDEGFILATRNNPNHPHPMAKMNPYRTED